MYRYEFPSAAAEGPVPPDPVSPDVCVQSKSSSVLWDHNPQNIPSSCTGVSKPQLTAGAGGAGVGTGVGGGAGVGGAVSRPL